ncbi:NAD(P)-dependent dehydrogenase (short-subunit alcohol dehydrogenase family) [Actinomycetospora succinea]|uniref:NAD(P)-dependent dehydrogenase (Short-subunit alcohol dehydrogenase family) n=1 Tax=Actinomycetospora succinea TaxID=663603 RepID=A0A4R6VFP5_9PSEU|nr:SDR family NAD(P)-dependent oxidoreductase [Actinomycetospora succinea]TDQ61161.1 NAD(P)-dependent dehydrogenase (short-subunit alcohol dehydrogenase family) [Actinomycetospora succinea]
MARLDGKVAIITGGESGIGRASASAMVDEGAQVHLIGLDAEALKRAVAELGDDKAASTQADVTDEDAVRSAVAEAIERFGHLDVVFSNAGNTGAVAPIEDYPSDEFARTLQIHALGAFHMIKHTSPHLDAGASIIITSSVVGLMGFAGISGYVAAKHAQVGMMKAAAKELTPRKIRVNSLHPGPTSTPFQDSIEMRATGLGQQEAAAAFDELVPLARHATPAEIAKTVVYLASDDSAYMTGATVAVDGGLTI